LFEGVLELLGVHHAAEVAVEDIEGGLDVANLLNGDGEGGVVLGLPNLLLGSLGLCGSRLAGGSGLGDVLAHANISKLILIKINGS
jgi:hypothetical protein